MPGCMGGSPAGLSSMEAEAEAANRTDKNRNFAIVLIVVLCDSEPGDGPDRIPD